MKIVDRGSGPPLVLIPGLQGRWEYMRPAVDALASTLPRADVLAVRRARLAAALDARAGSTTTSTRSRGARRAGIERATICGVSFGGLVARALRGAAPGRAAARSSWRRRRGRRWHLRRAPSRSTRARRGSSVRSSSPSRRSGCGRRSAPRFPTPRARRRFAPTAAAHAARARRCRCRAWPRAPRLIATHRSSRRTARASPRRR